MNQSWMDGMIPLFLSLLFYSSTTQNSMADWNLTRLESHFDVQPEMTIQIQNKFGSIRVRQNPGTDVFIISNVQQPKSDNHEYQLNPLLTKNMMNISPAFSEFSEDNSKKTKKRVDLTVLVPRGPKLYVETYDDLLEVKGIGNPLETKTFSGEIILKTKGPIVSFNRQGKTKMIITDESVLAETKIDSVIGPIELFIPSEANLTIKTQTSGEITSDFTTEIIREKNKRMKHLTMTSGTGSHSLKVTTIQGNLKFLSWYDGTPEQPNPQNDKNEKKNVPY